MTHPEQIAAIKEHFPKLWGAAIKQTHGNEDAALEKIKSLTGACNG